MSEEKFEFKVGDIVSWQGVEGKVVAIGNTVVICDFHNL